MICPIAANINFDNLVKVLSARFPYCEVMTFPYVIDKYLWGVTLKLSKYPVTSQNFTMSFSTHWRFLAESIIILIAK